MYISHKPRNSLTMWCTELHYHHHHHQAIMECGHLLTCSQPHTQKSLQGSPLVPSAFWSLVFLLFSVIC